MSIASTAKFKSDFQSLYCAELKYRDFAQTEMNDLCGSSQSKKEGKDKVNIDDLQFSIPNYKENRMWDHQNQGRYWQI